MSCSSHNIKVQKSKEYNIENSVSSNRLLLLDITDGFTALKAMEYKSIAMIDLKVKPGTKVS